MSFRNDDYVVLKVCVSGLEETMELAVSCLLKSAESEDPGIHPGFDYLRVVLDDIQIQGRSCVHKCHVFAPKGLALTKHRNLFPD